MCQDYNYSRSFITVSSFKKIAFTVLTSHLSEFAGRLVTGLKIDRRSKQQYNKYTRPTLNGVNKSKVLQRKCPPGGKKMKREKHILFYIPSFHQKIEFIFLKPK